MSLRVGVPEGKAGASATPGVTEYDGPISTLERQYGYLSSQSSRLTLVIRASAECCVKGGVEAVLKARRQEAQRARVSGSSSLMLSDVASTHSEETDDPFDFLGDSSTASTSMSSSSSSTTPNIVSLNDTQPTRKNRLQQGSKFLQRVAKTGVRQIERGMTNIAIKADQGRNPDWISVGAYATAPGSEICLGMTEFLPLPGDAPSDIVFRIPILLPAHLPKPWDSTVQLRFLIKSGASILHRTKIAKTYTIGTALVTLSKLQNSLSMATHGPLSYPLQSFMVSNGKLDVSVLPDLKFPSLHQRGWSLTDPASTGYTQSTAITSGLFNYPLDQSYVFSLPGNNTWVATERCIESALVLPLATSYTRLLRDAALISTDHASSVSNLLRHNSIGASAIVAGGGAPPGHAYCNVGFSLVQVSQLPFQSPASNMASVQVSLQLPDSIFEVNLGSGMVPLMELGHGSQPPSSSMPVALNINFYPKLCTHANSRILATAAAGASPNAIHLGTLRLEIRLGDPRGRGAGGSSRDVGDSRGDMVMLAYLALEPFLNAAEGSMHRVNIYLASTGVHMGSMTLTVSAQAGVMVGPEISPPVKSATNGLVSIVGLDCLVEEFGCGPALDYDPSNISPNIAAAATKAGEDPQVKQRKKHQLQTMGDFISEPYLNYHATHVRSLDTNALIDRFNQYNVAMGGTGSATPDLDLEIHQRKSPRPFRPSSTRSEGLLSGIGFNVHVQSLALTALEDGNSAPNKFNGSLFYSVTCGAPADHARGFGNVTVNSSSSNSGPPPGSAPGAVGISGPSIASGGLRRLESKRAELGKIAMDAQTALIHAIASHFSLQASMGGTPIPGSSRRHLPSSNLQIARLRREAIQKMEALNSLTWTCAVRRGNVFSQALGIAITSYLTAVCDSDKVQAGWADLWVRHGYLITFEGLLSAAGKELGMIEDAATGIAMLRMVNVVICQEHEGGHGGSRVPVVHSPHIRWVDMTASGVGSSTEYHLRIGIDPAFYAQRIPAALQNGAVVKFFPLLFQMGVDIRQWGANAGMGLKNQIKNNVPGGGQIMAASEEGEGSGGDGGLLDDEDDDVGATDNDFLIALNYEAFGKMNAYVNLIAPVSASPFPAAASTDTVPGVHPMLSVLQDYIRSSAGKMHHGVLVEAASATKKLGGGGAIFCKSGKDRTAMQVTFKQAQFVQEFQRQVSRDLSSNTDPNPEGIDEQAVINDATLMRIHGTRLPICEKNVGQSKFAFNALQSKFMPEVLKPPPSTLAGFLKGGRVFSRDGGIES